MQSLYCSGVGLFFSAGLNFIKIKQYADYRADVTTDTQAALCLLFGKLQLSDIIHFNAKIKTHFSL